MLFEQELTQRVGAGRQGADFPVQSRDETGEAPMCRLLPHTRPQRYGLFDRANRGP